jgi:hypothetical protein
MKTNISIVPLRRNSRDGSAVFIILVLLTIMVMLMAANTATLNRLSQHVKIVDQRQTQRLASGPTNQPVSK